jgi:hypothetical protein
MNKLQLYITKSGNTFKSLFNLNPNEDISRHVRNLSNVITKIAYDADEKNIFYFISSIADGVCFTILRTIPPQMGHHLAAWIFIPNGLQIDGEALEQVVRLTTRKVSNAEVSNADVSDLRTAFAMEYPTDLNAPSITAGQGVGIAWRAYGGNTGLTLGEFTGRGRFQQCYIPFGGVLLVDEELGYDVDATDLTDVPLGDEAVLLPPEKSEEGFTAYVFDRPLDRPIRGTLGAPLTITWRRPGFEDVSRTEVVNAIEFTPSPVSTESSHKTITPNSFYITSQVSKAELKDCSIRVNGREIEASGHSFTCEELRHAAVLISCEGHFPFSGQLDLASTTRALIQLQERRKIYRFELPVISSSLGAPIKFEIQSKVPLTQSPLEGYALLDDIQEGTTRTNHLGFVGSSTSLTTKLLYGVIGFIIGLGAMFVFNQCSGSSSTSRHLSPAANPDSIVAKENPVVDTQGRQATVTDITPVQETPVQDKATSVSVDNSLTVADAVKYLDNNTVWDKKDLDRNPSLVGLFDDMNNYRIDRLINVWAPKFSASEKMQLVAKHAEQGKHKGKAKLEGTTYNQPEDTRISVQGYLNRIDP